MRYRRLGKSGIEVSEIALGSWLTYGAGIEREHTEACTRAAFDAGINLFDTANIYGVGAAESAWGEILKDFVREDYVLATKLYFPMSETDRGLSREQVHKQLDASLDRLQTDYIDLYQCHRPDPETPIEETMEALTEVVEAGKVREIGFSEWTVEQVQASLDVPGTRDFVSSQPQYNMIWRAPEAELIPFCSEHGISQIVWSPLAQGVLTGKYPPGRPPPEGTRAANDEMSVSISRYMVDAVLEAVQRVERDRGGQRHRHGSARARLGAPRRRTCRRRSSAPRVPSRSTPTPRRRGSSYRRTCSTPSTRALDGVVITKPQLAAFAQEGVKHR